MILLSILSFIIIFSFLILVHEWGHFTAAKKSGVKVEEFGMGLPPRIWGIKKGETLYSINWIPFGGFVRLLGEGGGDGEAKTSKRSLMNKSLRVQAFIITAGVIMNISLSFILLTFGFVFGMEPIISSEEDLFKALKNGVINVELADTPEGANMFLPAYRYFQDSSSPLDSVLGTGDVILEVEGARIYSEDDLANAFSGTGSINLKIRRSGGEIEETSVYLSSEEAMPDSESVHPVISYVEADSPADLADLKEGFQLLSVNGQAVSRSEDVVAVTQAASKAEPIRYELNDGEEILYISVLPREEDHRIGIGISDIFYGEQNVSLYQTALPYTVLSIEPIRAGWGAPVFAIQEMWRLGKMTAVSFAGVLKEFVTGGAIPEGVSGPVGIAQMTYLSVQEGWMSVLRLAALLSLSLGVINILPLPALDGGRLLFILMQGITGRKLNSKYEVFIHSAGFIFLLLFLAFVTWNDVLNLF